jgi:hypothetical protein
MRVFIENALHLNIAEEKSRISHAAKGTFFLSYEVIMRTTDKLKRIKSPKGRYTLKRTVVDRMTLRIPEEKLRKFCHNKGYGDYNTLKTQHRPILRERSDIEIVLTYNAELRGLANYYCLAYSAKSRLSRLYYIWKGGLLKTLAAKHKTTVRKVMKSHKIGKDLAWRYEAKGKTRTQRAFSIRQWSPSWTANRDIDIQPYTYAFTAGRTEIVQRLNARKCEYCGTTEGYFDVHHIRKLADLKDGKALWQKVMSAMRRKTLVLCIECHDRLHSGQLPDWRWRSRIEAESRMP